MRLLRTTALGVVVLGAVLSLRPFLGRSRELLAEGLSFATQDPLSMRRRVFGAEYADAIEDARRRIPRSASYALVERAHDGGIHVIRFDLAPRRPLLWDPLSQPQQRPPAEWVVVVREWGRAPQVLTADDYAQMNGR